MTFPDNPQMDLAYQILEKTASHLFLTGRAGTGKTTFLRTVRRNLPKRMVVLAPTGIAAINAEGVTIHSFFQLPFAPYIPGSKFAQPANYGIQRQKLKLIRSLDLLIIDEISMVRADLLDAVDESLRRIRRNPAPFGGVQLLLIGDLQQLSPVVKDEEKALLDAYYPGYYFFNSLALRQTNYATVELQQVYRQNDTRFLSLLNAVREGQANEQVLAQLNTRYQPNLKLDKATGYIRLVTHNWQAHAINSRELEAIAEPAFSFDAEVTGKFPESSYPTDYQLVLKRGAQVMFVKNDVEKRYFNGMIGVVEAIDAKCFKVRPNDTPDQLIDVQREAWTNARYDLDEQTNEIKEVVDGVFTQFPVKAAWAITIHKSQGLTFDHAIIDVSGSFAHGQAYVALSRCRTLEGMILTTPIPKGAIIADEFVSAYSREVRSKVLTQRQFEEMQQAYVLQLLTETFTFTGARAALSAIVRVFEEYLSGIYPETTQLYAELLVRTDLEIVNVSSRFHQQYQRMLYEQEGGIADMALQERIRKGAGYFYEKLREVSLFVREHIVPVDNAVAKKRITAALEQLTDELYVKQQLMLFIRDEGFGMQPYLAKRTELLLEIDRSTQPRHRKQGKEAISNNKQLAEGSPAEVNDPKLYAALQQWRREKARQLNVPAYTIMHNKALIALANMVPKRAADLQQVPYVGTVTLQKYGSELIELLGIKADDWAECNALTPKGRPRRAPKETTDELSLRLYREGNSPEEIAQIRDLTLSTIKNHLLKHVIGGDVNFYDIVPRHIYEWICNFWREHPETRQMGLGDMRAAMNEAVSYKDLKYAVKYTKLLEG